MNDIAYLIGQKYSFDENGNHISENTEKMVFAQVKSAYSKEFFNARQTGLKAEFKLVIWAAEYSDEKMVRFGNNVYDVYRTFVNNDFVELYLSEKVGVWNDKC